MFSSDSDVRKKYWCVYSIEGECYLKIFQQFSIYFKGKQFSQPEDRLFSSSQMRKVFPSKLFFFLLRQDRKYFNKAWWPEICENTKHQVTEEWILNNNEEQDSNEQCSIMRHGSINNIDSILGCTKISKSCQNSNPTWCKLYLYESSKCSKFRICLLRVQKW